VPREWRFLLGAAGGLKAQPTTTPFVARNAARLLSCLPGTGDELGVLAEQLGLELSLPE
jgi:hypothetical protein